MKQVWCTGVILGLLVIAGCKGSGSKPAATVVIDGNSSGQIFYGIGGVSAGASSRLLIDYPEPERSQILDYLFKPGYGAALQHLKVEIGADTNSTDGSEPGYARTPTDRNFTRGYEWWLMTEARKRNPNIVLDSLAWGAPGWVGKFYSKKTAEYMAGFLEGAKDKLGLDIQYTGIWNETPYSTDYVKMLRQVLNQHGLKTRIVCCDEYPSVRGGEWSIVGKMLEDPELGNAIAAVTVHYPRTKGWDSTPKQAREIGKPLWSSEDQPHPRRTPRDWVHGGRSLAKIYNDNYLKLGLTATEIWSPITSYYDILAAPNSGLMYANTPWSGHYNVQSTIWVTAHTTQFTQPGWQYLDSACGYLPDKGNYVTLRSPNHKDWSVILQTIDATQPQSVTFHIQGGLSGGTVHVWETNSTKVFDRVADVTVKDGSFSYRFDPDALYSLTTTTGQGKGSATPPPPAPFPLPWKPDFDKVTLNGTPPYLSDQNGAFEVRTCHGRAGRCLEQVITERPIPWGSIAPDPWTLAGSEKWTDYRIRSDVHLTKNNSAVLMGRIDTANAFLDRKAIYPSGYMFRVDFGGKWSLLSTEYKKPTKTLAHGRFGDSGTGWHKLQLAFDGDRISASLDGKAVASVHDKAHMHGMFGLGTGWTHVQFDNVSVEPAD